VESALFADCWDDDEEEPQPAASMAMVDTAANAASAFVA
jgi:hypothetical protein